MTRKVGVKLRNGTVSDRCDVARACACVEAAQMCCKGWPTCCTVHTVHGVAAVVTCHGRLHLEQSSVHVQIVRSNAVQPKP